MIVTHCALAVICFLRMRVIWVSIEEAIVQRLFEVFFSIQSITGASQFRPESALAC